MYSVRVLARDRSSRQYPASAKSIADMLLAFDLRGISLCYAGLPRATRRTLDPSSSRSASAFKKLISLQPSAAAFNRWHLRYFPSDLSTGQPAVGSEIVL